MSVINFSAFLKIGIYNLSNLAFYIDNMSERVDDNTHIDCIYTNFSKAFDFSGHALRISKLE